jgi:allantoin racemase
LRANPALWDSYHDWLLSDIAVFEAGIEAEAEGFDAVCIDTMSDSALGALRSVLSVPVLAPARVSYHVALMLGNKFSVVTQLSAWKHMYRRSLQEYGLTERCASIRSIDVPLDVENLLGGREDAVFPVLVQEGMRAVEEDGADVILLGSTAMHQAGDALAEALPVPVINPGPLIYKMAEAFLDLGLTHSRHAYQMPGVSKPELVHALLDGGEALGKTAERTQA